MNMRKRRVIIYDTDRDLVSTLSYYFAVRGEYEVLTYYEPLFCPVWAHNTDCTNACACSDIIIAGTVPGGNGINLFSAQSHRGCEVSMRHKALICSNFNDNTIREVMDAGCAIFEKPIDLNKMTVWLHHHERHMDLSKPLRIKRKETRYASDKPVEYAIRPNANIFTGTSVNTSSSGLCLTTDIALRDEQTVTINPLAPNSSRASVRWSQAMTSGSYIVGLQFM